jgi:hypothetical protein
MITRLAPKLAPATVAAVAMYLCTLGLPMLVSCTGVAGAAPSPTCASDLRECLRLSAKEGLYGARYVTADDVARCVEAFNSCIHGTANGNPNPPTSTSTGGGSSRKGLPQHFGISYDGNLVGDCRVSGDAVNCDALNPYAPVGNQDSWTSAVTGTLSGLTMTGTKTIRVEGHYPGEPGCFYTEEASGPATYVFDSNGTVLMREGPIQWQKTNHGSCSGGESQTSPATEGTATWSAIG